MNLIANVLRLALVMGLLGASSWAKTEEPAKVKPDALEVVLGEVLRTQLKAMEEEVAKDTMETIHSQAPLYVATKNILQPIFESYNLKYEVLSLKLIGKDNDYGILRTNIRTTKTSGATFKNNDVDQLLILKQEDGKWKVWAQTVLDFRYIE